jgi:hypothetical protein
MTEPIIKLSTNKKYTEEEITASRNWFREELANLSSSAILPDMTDLRQRRGNTDVEIGKMIFYKYDPKYKDTLPYYDIFPLIIVTEMDATHFSGINLHYLPVNLRIILMERLLSVINNHKMDRTTKFKVTYKILAQASKFKYFRPCYHRYLIDHVKSKINVIRPAKWPHAIILPVARFKKSSEAKVWAESRRKY